MKRNLLILLFLLPTFVFSENSEKTWYIPDHVKIQFAGNIGFLSTGIGYTFFNELLSADLMHGYVPKFITNTRIHIITQKNTFSFVNKSIKGFILSPVTGFTLSYETGNNSFILLADKYPKGYYRTNAIHSTFFIGGKIYKDFDQKSIIKGIDFIAELGTVDVYLWYKIQSREIKLYDIFSLALGISIHI